MCRQDVIERNVPRDGWRDHLVRIVEACEGNAERVMTRDMYHLVTIGAEEHSKMWRDKAFF